MDPVTISSLTNIGMQRFKCQARATNCFMNHHADQKLEKLSIVSKNDGEARYHANLMNGWREGGAHFANNRPLVLLGSTLRKSIQQIANLEHRQPSKHVETSADKDRWKELKNIFNLIKKYTLTSDQDLSDIYVRSSSQFIAVFFL
jgi:hypothetical protein